MAKIKKEDRKTLEFLKMKKDQMKKSQYRVRFDALVKDIKKNLINTTVSYGEKIQEQSGWASTVFYNKQSDGSYDINVYPQKMTTNNNNGSSVPSFQEPIAFSKILIATSVLAGKLPDATVIADDKIYAKSMYELWKRTWSMVGGNGANTLMIVYQNLLTYGWGAWRIYPRRVQVPRNGTTKILFDDVYREPMDVERTWLGAGFNHGDYWSWGEVYYEKDMMKDEFYAMFPDGEKNKKLLEYCTNVTDEAKEENNEKAQTHVTIGYYENELLNRYVVACGDLVLYDGELPNDGSHGSVITARCFVGNLNDPHGVGLYEMMRGNTALYTYLNSLNAQEVEAEIFPLLFGAQVQNGTGTYRRGPNIINPKHPGVDITSVKTSGNIAGGVQFADKQKENIEQNTGINNIVAGQNSESTLGSTVILKEAAYQRLTPPKNSIVTGLEKDAHITVSWIEQIYPVDKVFMIDSDEQLAEFARQNPDYFVESQAIVDDNYDLKGYAVAASKNLRLNYDFTKEGDLMENVDTRTISARNLFEELDRNGHKSDYVEFMIDPDSMLLPSIEIQKQTFMAIFPLITNQITVIYSLRNTDPEAAASQLMALEKMLDVQKLDIFDFVSKNDYDAILNKQPSGVQREMQEKTMAMDAMNTELQTMAGGGPDMGQGTNSGQKMTKDGAEPLQPQNPEELPRPQSPMGSAVDASVGRAANAGGFFPG